MKTVHKSAKLANVLYDIRGPIMDAARRMEEEGHKIIKLNIGNLAPFGFDAPESFALRETVRWAHRSYKDMGVWTRLIQNGMAQDYSWTRSAEQYVDVYQNVLRRKGR